MFGMSFLFPAFLAGALAAVIPIALHLMRRQAAPRIHFSAVRFLHPAPVEQSRQRRLRELLLLALRVTALALLALAFARPFWSDSVASATSPITVVAVDVSFSLSAPGQAEAVRRLAREAVERVPREHLVGLLRFGDDAELVASPEAGRGVALEAVDRLAPGFGGTRYDVALARAAEVIGPREGRIVVVTDLQRGGWDAIDSVTVPERIDVVVSAVAPPTGNLSVDALGRDGNGVTALVRSRGGLERSGKAYLSLDGAPTSEAAFTVGANLATEARFEVDLPKTGIVAVRVDDAEGYAGDNARWLVLDEPTPPRVLVVGATGDLSTDAFYLARALTAGEEGARFDLTATTGADVSADPEATLEGTAGIVLLSTVGLDHRAREAIGAYVTAGGGVLIPGSEDVEAEVVADMLGSDPVVEGDALDAGAQVLTLAPVDVRHPIFRSFGVFAGNLGQVRFSRTRALRETAARTIARFNDGSVALAEVRKDDGLVLVFASDLNNAWNDFPLHPTFVPFLHEAIRHLTQDRVQPREYVVADVPADAAATAPGPLVLGTPPRQVAVNVDLRESSPDTMSEKEFQAAITRGDRPATPPTQPEGQRREEEQAYWRYALILMAAVLVGESLLGRRMT